MEEERNEGPITSEEHHQDQRRLLLSILILSEWTRILNLLSGCILLCDGHLKWGVLNLMLMFPSYFCQVFTPITTVEQEQNSPCRFLRNAFSLASFPLTQPLWYLYQYFQKAINLDGRQKLATDILKVSIIEGFAESAPQVILQLVILERLNKQDVWRFVVITANVASVAFHSIRLALDGVSTGFDLFFPAFQLIWNILVLWFLALQFKYFLVIVILGLLMLAKILKTQVFKELYNPQFKEIGQDFLFTILPLWITTFHLKTISRKYFMLATLLSISVYSITFFSVSVYLNQNSIVNCNTELLKSHNSSQSESFEFEVTSLKVKPCIGSENQSTNIFNNLIGVLALQLGFYVLTFCLCLIKKT